VLRPNENEELPVAIQVLYTVGELVRILIPGYLSSNCKEDKVILDHYESHGFRLERLCGLFDHIDAKTRIQAAHVIIPFGRESVTTAPTSQQFRDLFNRYAGDPKELYAQLVRVIASGIRDFKAPVWE